MCNERMDWAIKDGIIFWQTAAGSGEGLVLKPSLTFQSLPVVRELESNPLCWSCGSVLLQPSCTIWMCCCFVSHSDIPVFLQPLEWIYLWLQLMWTTDITKSHYNYQHAVWGLFTFDNAGVIIHQYRGEEAWLWVMVKSSLSYSRNSEQMQVIAVCWNLSGRRFTLPMAVWFEIQVILQSEPKPL